MLIGIIIGIVFFFLLGKAILETIWGSCLIVCGVFCQILAHMLYTIAYGLRTVDKLKTTSKRQTTSKTTLTNSCKMWSARFTLTVLTITFFGSVVFLTNHSLCIFSEINWQACSDWIHAIKAIGI